MNISRRNLLSGAAAVAALSMLGRGSMAAQPAAGFDTGVQLYMARDLLQKDFEGTLAGIARTGIKQVEFAGFYERSASDLRAALKANGLQAIGAHCVYADMPDAEVGKVIEFCAEVGMPYVVAAAPSLRIDGKQVTSMEQYIAAVPHYSLDDARRSADRFNRIGELVKAAGLQFAYHNHGFELQRRGDTTGFDELLQRTDPALVLLELDIGNLIAGGGDPLHYLREYPRRFRLAHLKDWAGPLKPDPLGMPPSAAFGQGVIDWKPILAAARAADIQHFFIEQEQTPADQVIEVIRTSQAYFRAL